MTEGAPLVLVSNRGPVTHQDDGSIKRGTGGLVTALTGLASHRDAVWIASALTDGDKRRARKSGGEPFVVHTPEGGEFHVRLVVSDDQAYDRFYNVFANPMLWFIQHYLWDLSNAPDIRRHEVEAFEYGYNVVNDDLAEAVVEQIEGVDEPVVMVHDYHLYTLPGLVRRARPDVFLHHFVHIPWTQPDAWRVLPTRIRREIYEGLLANDIIGFHTRSYRWNFLQCCRDLMDLDVDFNEGIVHAPDGREVWVRAYPLPIDYKATQQVARSARTKELEAELLRRRREWLVLRVDRADLSKNVLRGFSAFDLFLEQHPEFRERVTFIAQLMPSRTDVPEYAEYLERIEALVAVVNHRHGTPDWMPIQLKLRDDLEEAMASYKHYDVLLVNAMFDGMNLVAKEGPLVNEHNGVSVLSENTGAHEELGEFALSVNPFDIQETADSIHAALTMSDAERERGPPGSSSIVMERDPGDWIDDQLADIARRRDEPSPGPGRLRAGRGLTYSTPNSLDGARHGAGAGGGVGAGTAAGAVAVAAAVRARPGSAGASRLRLRGCRVGVVRAGSGCGSAAGSGSGSGVVTGSAGAGAWRTGTAAPRGTSGAGARSRGQATTRAATATSASARPTLAHRTRPRMPGVSGSVSMTPVGPAPANFAPLPL